jgi:hypothetical protein
VTALVWNATEGIVEFEGQTFRPSPTKARGLAYLAARAGEWVTHRDLTEAMGLELNSRPMNDFLKVVLALRRTFGPDKRGVENHRGRIRWAGVVKRTLRVAIGKPLVRPDGSRVGMAEAVDFMAATYGLEPQARSDAATILRASDRQFAVLADDGNGGVLIVLAGQGMRDVA